MLHDPSEISDSESFKSNEDKDLKRRRKRPSKNASRSTLAKSEVLSSNDEVQQIPQVHEMHKPNPGIFGFSIGQFFSQVKKNLFDGSN